ncbi:GNAT family N-acetyltransferase [Candidatus Babeliales bacterium]|nr:GNAT family N-acetyltransferase [Candidatus Babeliales bacterium]
MKPISIKLYFVLFLTCLLNNTFSCEITKVEESDKEGIRAILEQDLSKKYVIGHSLQGTLHDIFDLNTYTTLVAKKDEHVVGFATYKHHVNLFARGYEWVAGEKNRMLQHLAVDKAHQRDGVGKKLIQAIIKNLQKEGINYVVLSVIAENKNACMFYERQGFYLTYPGIHRLSQEEIEARKDEPLQYYEYAL